MIFKRGHDYAGFQHGKDVGPNDAVVIQNSCLERHDEQHIGTDKA
jgi:hypothetical protein